MTDVRADDQLKLLPCYLVCDVSASMESNGAMEAANQILPDLVVALENDPIICDKVRFSVIDFSDDATLVLPLCDLLSQQSLPQLRSRGGTSYRAAFDFLRMQIEQDVNQLKGDMYQVHRPAVFFLSDGAPTDQEDEWRNAFANLTHYDKQSGAGFRMYPNIIPFGVAEADPGIMKELIHPKAPKERAMKMFLADERQSVGEAVSKMAKMLVQSVLKSGAGVAGGGGGIVLPEDDDLPEGIESVSADDMYL